MTDALSSAPSRPSGLLPLAPSGHSRLQGKRVVVVGLARSGLAAIRLARSHGALVTAVDQRTDAELGQVAEALRSEGVTLVLGSSPGNLLATADAVVVSPGVPLALPELQAARAAGVPVVGEIELAWSLLSAHRGPVLGITGTNGKSTTTALTGELMARSGARTFVGGNLGIPYSEAALDPKEFDAHVVELSSFQLEGIETARFSGAALLNLSPDHLDRYVDAEAYAQAKARIFRNQRDGDFAVLNADDAAVMALTGSVRVPRYGFTHTGAAKEGFAGLAVADDRGFHFDFGEREAFTVSNRALRGAHNLENAMAAALLAKLSGVGAEAIQTGLDRYPGLPHRLEPVRVLDGVEWINDSKATNVDSAIVALKALPGRVWLIAGGKGKAAPYAPLVAAGRGKLLGVLTLGEDAPAIEAAFAGAATVYPCGTLAGTVARARELAQAGDVVLLSPACASYDQFRNFEDRGDTFKRLVGAL